MIFGIDFASLPSPKGFVNLTAEVFFAASSPWSAAKTGRKLALARNNNKIIKDVYRKEEIYSGPYLDQAPDIVAIPEDHYEFFGMHGFTFNKMIIPTFGNSGSHRENGIFIAKGKYIKSNLEIKGANIVDIAPTILYIMGLLPPKYMDGKVLYEKK